MENPWFKKGLDSKHIRSRVVNKELTPLNADAVFGSCGHTSAAAAAKPQMAKLTNLNAFDIISLSTGFDLSGLFVENVQKEEVQFTSPKPALAIISKVEDIAGYLKLKVKKEGGVLKLEGSNEGKNVPLSIDVEFFEITPSFHFVELRKTCGDTVEYQKLLKQDIKPALKEIVWVWQGPQQQ